MKIAMLTNNYKPFVGGVPISVERLAEGLRESGHEVYVFAPTYENQVDEKYVIRYKSLRYKAVEGKVVIPNIIDSIFDKTFKSIDFDIIHVHHPMLMGQVASYLGKKYKIPVTFTYHTRYEQYLHYFKPYDLLEERYKKEKNSMLKNIEGKILEFTKDTLTPKCINLFANRCDRIFAPTTMMAEYLKEKGSKSKVSIMPTGLDEKYFKENLKESREIRNKYIEDKKYLFITVSRLAKEKNIEFIINGLKMLKDRCGDIFKLLVIGEGPLKDELLSKARALKLEKNIEFIGSIDNNKIGDYYRACDMFLFASKSETQGIVLLEAMAAKKPIVAIKASGVVEVVENNINGYMTEDNLNSWVDKLEMLVNNSPLVKKLGEEAYTTALRFKNSNVAKMAEKNYKEVITEFYRGESKYQYEFNL